MNQNPEQLARDAIDRMLFAAGWLVQPKQKINLAAATGVAVQEYKTDIAPPTTYYTILYTKSL